MAGTMDEAQTVPDGRPSPHDLAERLELSETVLEAIRGLSEHERMATTLFYINCYTYRDIAGFLEMPETTVKKRLYSAREHLRRRLVGAGLKPAPTTAGLSLWVDSVAGFHILESMKTTGINPTLYTQSLLASFDNFTETTLAEILE